MISTYIWTILIGCNGNSKVSEDTATPVVIEAMTPRSCDIILEHTPNPPSLNIEVAGEFSDWAPLAMEDSDGDGTWSVNLGPLSPGEYGHKFIYGGLWQEDLSSAETHWVDGVENVNFRVGNCNQPMLHTLESNTSDGTISASLQFQSAASGAEIDLDSLIVTVGGVDVTPDVDVQTGIISITANNLAMGKHSIHVWATDTDGQPIEQAPYFLPLWVEETPFDWRDGLMYFAMLDRFRNSDISASSSVCDPVADVADIANLKGGDIQGLIESIEEGYLDELGIRSIWLSPLYQNADGGWYDRGGDILFTSYHGYWPTDNREVETCLGDVDGDADARLRELVEVAHAHGIRILLDLVLNHVHQDHPWVEEHPDWFNQSCVCGLENCDWEERRLDCWFTDYLPDLNYRQHDVVTQAVSDVTWWLEEYDVDGFRIDAAKHMDTVILNNIRLRLEETVEEQGGAELYLVGETFTGGDGHDDIMRYVSDNQLHGQFDFPLMWSIRDSFIWSGTMRDLDNKVQTGLYRYGDSLMSPFAGNHDITRLATEISGGGWGPWNGTPDYMAEGEGVVTQPEMIETLSLIHAFTFTQPGVPLLYYGDEIGLAGDGDPDNRRVMNFEPYLSENQRTMLRQTQDIVQSRNSSEALRRGTHQTLWVDDSLYVYARYTDDDVALVVLNTAYETREQTLPIPFAEWDGLVLETLVGQDSESVIQEQSLTLSIDSRRYGIYRLR